jgi:hypothetical protein
VSGLRTFTATLAHSPLLFKRFCEMRKVICHYHIYKNSGTSFDTLLTNNFGDKHVLFDGPFPFFCIDQEQLLNVIERRPGAAAFSSHQIQLPVPVSLDIQVLPVVFVRHPILRIQSIYNFKRKYYDGTITSKNARSMSFDQWANYCLGDNLEIGQVSNTQTRMIGGTYRNRSLKRRKGMVLESDLQQALRNIVSVELLARTEFFDHDVSRFPAILKAHGIEFSFEQIGVQNSTRSDQHLSIEQRLDSIRESVSGELYRKLEEANNQDIQLFDFVSCRLGAASE